MTPSDVSPINSSALNSARKKAFLRLLPVLFLSYLIAYVDRNNVAVASLTMTKDLAGFNDAVFGFGAGIFFLGYFLLEIPGTLIVEKWSARKWICRIMVSWGIMAAMTAFVHWDIPVFSPVCRWGMGIVVSVMSWIASIKLGWLSWLAGWAANTVATLQGPEGLAVFQFYSVRFLLGLAEAGFFPGVIVYLTHWFTVRDRAKALSLFLIATPFAQVINPIVAKFILPIGTSEEVNGVMQHHPELWGLEGWQVLYILWGIPAVVLGIGILWLLTDRPRQAKWLSQEERDALENELTRERSDRSRGRRMTVLEALRHPKVILLTLAYFCTVTASYGVEFFMPKVIKDWYSMDIKAMALFIILPPMVALLAQLGAGWSSDHFKERRYHAVVPLLMGAGALGLMPFTQGSFWLTLICFMVAYGGFKGYMPAFWSLPNLFLVEAAAAGSIGLINSVGNLGGWLGPTVMGYVKETTGSYAKSLWFLSGSMCVTAVILFTLGLGARRKRE